MTGAAYAMRSLSHFLFIVIDSDMHVVPQVKAIHNEQANIFHL